MRLKSNAVTPLAGVHVEDCVGVEQVWITPDEVGDVGDVVVIPVWADEPGRFNDCSFRPTTDWLAAVAT